MLLNKRNQTQIQTRNIYLSKNKSAHNIVLLVDYYTLEFGNKNWEGSCYLWTISFTFWVYHVKEGG